MFSEQLSEVFRTVATYLSFPLNNTLVFGGTVAIMRILIFFCSKYTMHEWTDTAQVLSADCHTRTRESNNTEEADTNPSKPFTGFGITRQESELRAQRDVKTRFRGALWVRVSPVKMSDMEDDFMCDDEEDYDLVRLFKIKATVNACDLSRSRHIDILKCV